MSYLARLKTLLHEKPLPEELTKPTKGASVSFVSDHGSPFCADEDADAIEERAALAADRVPGCYLDAWARLQCQRPHSVAAAEWRLAVNDAGLFLDAWGADAAAMGWSAGALFDVPRADRTGGLVWQLIGAGVEALGADHVRASDGRVILRGARERRPNSSIGNEERGGA
jgi:hypothetical protein